MTVDLRTRVDSEQAPVETALDVMKEWLSFATFDPEQVEAERGVILDEWRTRTESLSGRQARLTFDMFLGDTPYGDRWVIGDEASIENVTTEELVEFYDTYYLSLIHI